MIYDHASTNLDAHYTLKQMAFYSSIMIDKMAQLFEVEWRTFMDQSGPKSEATFVSFLMEDYDLTKPNAVARIAAAHKQAILDSDEPPNKMEQFISERNRNRKTPLTISTLDKTLFRYFLAAPPVADEFEGPGDFRVKEVESIVRLMNIISDFTLENQWNPELNNAAHQKAERIYYAGSIRAWSEVLRDAIAHGPLNLMSDDDRSRIFYREVSEDNFDRIKAIVERLFSHTLWTQPWGPTLEGLKIANNVAAKQVFKSVGLTAAWLLGISS